MDTQNFNKTLQSLANLNKSIATFKEMLSRKKAGLQQQKEAYKNNMAKKNAEIERFRQLMVTAVQKIDSSAQKIEEVIKENGTSNNLY